MALPPTNPPGLVRDAEDLNKVVNGEGTTNRAGDSLPSVKSVFERINDDFDAMQAGELTAQAVGAADRAETAAEQAAAAGRVYESSAAGQADVELVDGDYFFVVSADSDEVLELWRKGASSPTDTGKRTISITYVKKTGFAKIAGVAKTNINYDTATRTLTFSNTVHITTGTSRVQLTTPQSVVLDQGVMYRLEYNVSTGLIRARVFSQNYFEGYIPFALVRVYSSGKIETSDFQYAINGVAFDAVEVATDASAIDATIKDKVLEDKIVSQGSNLYDASAVTDGKMVLGDGSLADNTLYFITDFIAVFPSQQYTIKASYDDGTPAQGFSNIAYYDSNKNFISRDSSNNTGAESVNGALTLTMPNNAYYIRLNMQGGSATTRNRQINLGPVALPYEVYVKPTLRENIKVEEDDSWVFGAHNLGYQSVTLDKIDFVERSTNLFNEATATPGFVISNDGSLSPSASYSYSDYIAVIPNKKYTMTAKDSIGDVKNAFVSTAFYDKDKNFLSRISTQNADEPDGALTFTTLADAAYIRLNINGLVNIHNRQLNFGEVALPYEPYYSPRLTGVLLSDDIVEDISSRLEITKSDNVMTDIPIDGTFSTTQTWPEITNFRYTTAAQVYQMYDDLMALHPEYITKQTLGNDGLGNPIAVYKFTPAKPSSTVSTKYPKVFLTAGIHGFEHVPPLACYLMFEQMCNNWQSDELLEALRFNVDFLIIPVCNPSGWDDYTRTNHNGVDLNRNFPDGWALQGEGSSMYSGPSAASELETQYIMQVFDENPNINIMHDFHNFHGLNDGDPKWDRFIWIPSGSGAYVNHMAQMLASRMTRKWRKDYPTWFPTDHDFFAGRTTTSSHGATVRNHAYGRGIKFSATFEVCERWWVNPSSVPYDEEHKKTSVEAITNWLLINLDELKRI